MSNYSKDLDREQLGRLRQQLARVAPNDRGCWLEAWLSGACASTEHAATLRQGCADLVGASGINVPPSAASVAVPATAGKSPTLLAQWEDYEQGGLWRDLERLAQENPEAFRRLKDDYLARRGLPRGTAPVQSPAPARLLARWEDYDQGDLWRDLERLAKEMPAEFERLHSDYRARNPGPGAAHRRGGS